MAEDPVVEKKDSCSHEECSCGAIPPVGLNDVFSFPMGSSEGFQAFVNNMLLPTNASMATKLLVVAACMLIIPLATFYATKNILASFSAITETGRLLMAAVAAAISSYVLIGYYTYLVYVDDKRLYANQDGVEAEKKQA
eukprot:Platyproteum_vivax@DN7922_c0_g1_i1.p1